MTREEVMQSKADEFQLGMADLLKSKLGEAYDAGVASVVTPVTPDTQALIDAAVAAKAQEMQAQLDAKAAELSAKQADLDKALSDDAADKAQIEADKKEIAAGQAVIDSIRAILNPPAPAPAPVEQPAPAPVEQPAQ